MPTYDRSGLIGESIATLRRTLIEEAIVVSLVIIVFLFHLRSALVPILALPMAVVGRVHPDVLPRRHLQHHVARRHRAGDRRAGRRLDRDGGERVPARVGARRRARRWSPYDGSAPRRRHRGREQVGRPIFFSLAIIIVSFMPVFLLEAQEGRMFRPLAFTKTFAMVRGRRSCRSRSCRC